MIDQEVDHVISLANEKHHYIPGLGLFNEPVMDPGFPPGGGVNPPGGGGGLTHNFAKFSQKLHEIERIHVPP